MLHYPLAMYYYVRDDNTALYDALMDGLTTALEDGSYDELFDSHPSTAGSFERSDFHNRPGFRDRQSDTSNADLEALDKFGIKQLPED